MGDRCWGPIFSNYRAPLVIITTNQLVANYVKVVNVEKLNSLCLIV